MDYDVLVIGGGACGLAAARELVRAGKRVAVLEARPRLGGRIHLLTKAGFDTPVEAGAEFIHGELPVTLALLKEMNIPYTERDGRMYRVYEGKVEKGDFWSKDWPVMMAKVKELKEDMPFAGFFEQHLGREKYPQLWQSMKGYIEGYDLADTQKVSAFSLRREWESEEDMTSYHPEGGYMNLLNRMADEIGSSGSSIHLSAIVKEVRWKRGEVQVLTESSGQFAARKVLITVPLGVLRSDAGSKAHITFSPGLPMLLNAVNAMGFGGVIKILLQFKNTFWQDKAFAKQGARQMPGLYFLFSDAPVPTWWTGIPGREAQLTGWFGGPNAEKLKHIGDADLLSRAIESLAYIFGVPVSFIHEQLAAHYIANWLTDPFSLGAYAYSTPQSFEARKVLNRPIEDTLFFAGEALYEGAEMGAVEAALATGVEAGKVMSDGTSPSSGHSGR